MSFKNLLKGREWKYFKYEDIFIIQRGMRSDEKILNNGIYPLIGASKNNNGCNEEYINEYDYNGIYITVGNGGNTGCGQTFLQNGKFAAKSTVNILNLKAYKINTYIGIFLVTLIKLEQFRYNFGRGWSVEKMKKTILKLPSKNDQPDWSFMENYIQNIKKKIKLPTPESILKEKMKLNVNNWKYFKLIDLFNLEGIQSTKQIDLQYHNKGFYPHVSSSAQNNGIEGFYNFYTERGKVLTIDSAICGYCTYQEISFSANDINKLVPRFKINKYIALFLTTIINIEYYRYNYGRKPGQTRLKTIKIKLPSKNNQPDWSFMENYIKTLPYSSSL